jgi:tRNA-uridine 2-sulfurtransferase
VPERVLLAMSGGVDSTVAAARLVEQGHEVVGLTLHLWSASPDAPPSRCCAPEDVEDARRVCRQLGIPHYTLDRRDSFEHEIVQPFVDSYFSGRTPSPCARCNTLIKIPALLRVAQLLGAPRVATGHYARVVKTRSGSLRIARGLDRRKDQSYFLYSLGPSVLHRLVLPLGDHDKSSVRQESRQRGLLGWDKGESQDLCFVPSGDYVQFVQGRAPDRVRPGQLLGPCGQLLGEHPGCHRFTVGQRKGLGVQSQSNSAWFVTQIDAEQAIVRLGSDADLLSRTVSIDRPSLAEGLQLPVRASVQVRYRHQGQTALLQANGQGLRVVFDEPVRAAAIGQIAVAYDQDDSVMGGGAITAVER